jgi:Rod binding domain-containing protein
MTANISSVNDFQGTGATAPRCLRAFAGNRPRSSRQFEALFVQMMLKSMRDANAVLGESQDTTYQEMFDQQIAMEMTRGRGLGVAEMMSRQLGIARRSSPLANASASMATSIPTLLSRHSGPAQRCNTAWGELQSPGFSDLPAPDAPQPDLSALRHGSVAAERADFRPASREEFVREIWPLAVRRRPQTRRRATGDRRPGRARNRLGQPVDPRRRRRQRQQPVRHQG